MVFMFNKLRLLMFCIAFFLGSSCSQKKIKSINGASDTQNLIILSDGDFLNWWKFHSQNIRLSSNFIPVDVNSSVIDKRTFLTKLKSGAYLPYRLYLNENRRVYKLFKVGKNANLQIQATIKNEANIALNNLNFEGKKFPNIVDKSINGRNSKLNNRVGKIVLFKTWFIGCTACIKEFPKLNEIVENEKNNDKILFISLALDNRERLKKILKKRPFKYEVIPEQERLISELNLNIFPTHIVVNERNIIIKVCNNLEDLSLFLNENNIINR